MWGSGWVSGRSWTDEEGRWNRRPREERGPGKLGVDKGDRRVSKGGRFVGGRGPTGKESTGTSGVGGGSQGDQRRVDGRSWAGDGMGNRGRTLFGLSSFR